MTLRTLFDLSFGSARTIPPSSAPQDGHCSRLSVDEEARDFAPQVASITPEEVPVLRRGAVEQGRAHRSAELERRPYDS
jgi:hypothetical protein